MSVDLLLIVVDIVRDVLTPLVVLLVIVLLVIVIPTTAWVGADASGRDWRGDKFADKPWKWVLGCPLLWIIVFPMYLAKRGRAPIQAR